MAEFREMRTRYGLTHRDVGDLLRVYGFPMDFEAWTQAIYRRAWARIEADGKGHQIFKNAVERAKNWDKEQETS